MADTPPGNGKAHVFVGLAQAAWRHRNRTLLAMALLVAAKLAAVAVPLLLKEVIDRFSEPASLTTSTTRGVATVLVLPVFLLLGYALLRFAGTLFTELRDLVFARVTLSTVTDFAERCFAHLLSLSPRFHVQRNTGALIRDVERGTAGVGFLLGSGLFTVVPTLVEFAAVLAVMAAGYSLWFTLVIMVTFFVYAAFTTAKTATRALRQRRVNDMDSRANGRMVDTLLNYETVKTHAREGFERQRYASVLGAWVEEGVRNQRALSGLHIGQSAIIAAGVAAVMLLAAEQTVRGQMTVGDLVLVNSYIIQICLPLNALGFVFREARDALVNTEKLFGLLQQPVEIQDAPEAPPLKLAGGAVAFEQVHFGYEPGRPILHDLSLEIGAGQTVAVVGGSGSGKSTLARLLLRLYDPQQGRVTVDGQDLKHVQLDSLRRAVGVVPQDTVLFNDTIAYNIGYGRQGAGMADIIAAAQAAQVHEFIMSLPEQYDTVVGERGMKLSGGEKQRIAIARAFLKNPPLMIFDEATSALDTRAERAIQHELDRIAQGRTTLIIAHRLSTIVGADQIVVMDRGRIVERGRHEELLAKEGLYAQLWNLQLQQEQFEKLERRMARQPVNLAVLIAQAVDGLAAELDARQVRLSAHIDLGNASVTGDPTTLAQLTRELCVAAIQATPRGRRIEVRLERQGELARLTIGDGRHAVPALASPGAPEAGTAAAGDELAPLRLPFGLDTPLDPLTLRSTVERQGGRFSIDPPSASHGLRYVVELPLRPVAAAGPQDEDTVPGLVEDPAEAPPLPVLAGLRVLCLEPRPEARLALQQLLEGSGADVLLFDSAGATLQWLERHPTAMWPQRLLSEIALGGEDGLQFIRALRQLESRRGVPVAQRLPALALSGFTGPEVRAQVLAAGFHAHLSKPAQPQRLLTELLEIGRPLSSAQGVAEGTGPPSPPIEV
ncbi:ATP-binding cassette domain-containing protein [Azohydromonas caseinilytica]|uniref:ATP-binding cassette domain-containing protein n=1 Tax=Azohydromonas caseinilytica TaxID=2728836 RepID=A0A848F5I6_9BURK|nr:ATP-binding cassette domain-containing protein [Azohydromonas caseinilytica]NML13560.1 ATP-binding cassette domain-containing protein [Azohydromonas caseinilytica]